MEAEVLVTPWRRWLDGVGAGVTMAMETVGEGGGGGRRGR